MTNKNYKTDEFTWETPVGCPACKRPICSCDQGPSQWESGVELEIPREPQEAYFPAVRYEEPFLVRTVTK